MATVKEELEGKNSREDDFNSRFGGINVGKPIGLIIEAPDHLKYENGDGKAEGRPLQTYANKPPGIPVATVNTCTGTCGIAFGFGRFCDKYPKEEKSERGGERICNLSRPYQRLDGVQLEPEVRIEPPPLQYLGEVEGRGDERRDN